MLTTEDNELLTRVGSDAPMGHFLRRFWLPALLSDELPEPDCAPIRTRTLGEDLVAFRDSDGRVGILDAFCAHRRAPLFFGRNEECGLRCVYHGWKYDVDGQCVDMPSEPAESNFRDKIHLKSYPTREAGGIVWLYMGPPDRMPASPPQLPITFVPQSERWGLKFLVEANWLQCLEGELDTAHVSYLHSIFAEDGTGIMNIVREEGYIDRHPRLTAMETDYGMVYGGRRAKPNGDYYWRVTQYLLPIYALIPFQTGYNSGATIWMPIDDHHCWRYLVGATMPGLPRRIPLETEPGTFTFPDGISIDTRLAVDRKSNLYNMDRHKQRKVNYTGMRAIPTQDQAMTEGMGYVCDRSQEHLGTSDVAIIAARRKLLRLVREFEGGAEPYPATHPELYRVRPLDLVSTAAELSDLLDQNQEQARLPSVGGRLS